MTSSMRILAFLILALASTRAEPEAPARPKVALEALQRLKGMDLEANPSLKAAVDKIVEGARGTPDFIQIARILELCGEHPEILAIALKEGAASDAAVEGIRLILAHDGAGLIQDRLAAAEVTELEELVGLLGNAGDAAAIALLAEMLADPERSAESRRLAVRALARTEAGARALLASDLGDELAAAAAESLRVSPWPEIQSLAAERFPPAAAVELTALPSAAELATMRGDAARGALVAALPQTACLACHRIGERGVDFGPALTEIGNKLSREALIESILDPAASVSHGYQAWQISLKSGGSRAGFIVSETDDELVLKEPSGVQARVEKQDILSRTQIPGSMMPAGLEHTMTPEQFVDLIEYMTTLKP